MGEAHFGAWCDGLIQEAKHCNMRSIATSAPQGNNYLLRASVVTGPLRTCNVRPW